MKRFKDIPLKYQLTVVIVFISVVSLWLASTAFVFYDRYAYKENMVHELTILSRIVSSKMSVAVSENNKNEVLSNLQSLAIKNSIEFACVISNAGEVVAYFSREALSEESARKLCLQKPGYISHIGDKHIDLVEPVYATDSKRIADIYVRQDYSDLNKRFGVFSVVMFVILLFASGIAALLSSRVQRFFSTPLVSLKNVAESIAADNNYSIRVVHDRRDEIGQLYHAFNHMVETIESKNIELSDARDELEHRIEMRTSELNSINKELEAFTYSVSHDLRAPLRAIDGFSAALEEDCGDQLNSAGRDHLRRIRMASQTMGSLIEALLSLSRLSRIEMNNQSVDLVPIARDIADHLALLYPGRHFQFVYPRTLIAYGDKTLLAIVLDNLLANAWKYSANVPSPRIELGSVDRNGEQVYFIRDNGAGFNMKHAEKLFVPFQRLHKADEFEGIGIGLATVARIVHRHDGEVWAEGVVGGGATFYFTLGQRPLPAPAVADNRRL